MPKLTTNDIATFLAEPGHLLRLATIDDDGMPRISPVWCTYRPSDEGLGAILFTPRQRSRFFANLRRDARIALSIDEDALPYRKVSVQGTVTVIHDVGNDDAWRDIYREIACRFIPESNADGYLAATSDQPRALLSVDLDDAAITSWRMPVEGESGTGIWAAQYYADGSKMSDRLT